MEPDPAPGTPSPGLAPQPDPSLTTQIATPTYYDGQAVDTFGAPIQDDPRSNVHTPGWSYHYLGPNQIVYAPESADYLKYGDPNDPMYSGAGHEARLAQANTAWTGVYTPPTGPGPITGNLPPGTPGTTTVPPVVDTYTPGTPGTGTPGTGTPGTGAPGSGFPGTGGGSSTSSTWGSYTPPSGNVPIPPLPTTPNVASASSTGYNPTTRSINEDTDTVAGQIAKILREDSPYLQQARTGAMQTANQRGLLNSSIAASAGEDAAIRSALPIAGADAAAYNAAARDNQAVQNASAQFGAAAENQVRLFNAAEVNQMEKIGFQGEYEASIQKLRGDQARSVQELQSWSQMAVAGIQTEAQKSIAGMESDSRIRTQTIQSAGYAFQEGVKQINSILLNPDLDVASKQTAVDHQITMLRVGFAGLARLGNISTGDILNFYDEVNSGVYTGGPSLGPLPTNAGSSFTPPAVDGSQTQSVSDPSSPSYNRNSPDYNPQLDPSSPWYIPPGTS